MRSLVDAARARAASCGSAGRSRACKRDYTTLAALRRARPTRLLLYVRAPAAAASRPGTSRAGRCDARDGALPARHAARSCEAVRARGRRALRVDGRRRARASARLEALGVTGVITNDPRLFASASRSRRWRRCSRPGRRPRVERWPASVILRARRDDAAAACSQRKRTTPRKRDRRRPAARTRSSSPPRRAARGRARACASPSRRPVDVRASAPPSRYWTRKRIVAPAPRGSPGIDARMPISFGCLAVSHTLTVAHRRRRRGPCAARRRQEHSERERTSSAARCRITGRTVAPICDGSQGVVVRM